MPLLKSFAFVSRKSPLTGLHDFYGDVPPASLERSTLVPIVCPSLTRIFAFALLSSPCMALVFQPSSGSAPYFSLFGFLPSRPLVPPRSTNPSWSASLRFSFGMSFPHQTATLALSIESSPESPPFSIFFPSRFGSVPFVNLSYAREEGSLSQSWRSRS